MPPPSRRQIEALRACLVAESMKQAAFDCGMTYDRMRHVLHELYLELSTPDQRVRTIAQAVAAVDDMEPGWRRDDGFHVVGAGKAVCDDCLRRRETRANRRRNNPRFISPRDRWTILERDGFTCRYCGLKAPETELHVDHRVSKANGGGNGLDNLVTACITCNLGKAGRNG